jgi:defect-in-organelle-trafficking protein DotC
MRKTSCYYWPLLLLLLQACATTPQNIDTANPRQLSTINQKNWQRSKNTPKVSVMRAEMLQDTAMGLGAQAGLSWASGKINKQLNKDSSKLSAIFNFNAMLLSHGVIPPVLTAGDGNLNLADPNTVRIADKVYKIVKQAHFVTTVPHWREYLWLNYAKPTLPDHSLLPRNSEEQKIWAQAIKIGWNKGIQQAFNIFQQNLARLKRDYQGMILYRKLLQYHMINPPFVSRTELGITGDGSDMRINDQVLRITDLPQLKINSDKWHAIIK